MTFSLADFSSTAKWFANRMDCIRFKVFSLCILHALVSSPFSFSLLGYQGSTCEQKIDPCASGPCHNNGSCSPQASGSGYSCTCPAGYTGPTCAQLVDFCALNPCAHGICRSVGTSYRCLCVPGEDLVCFHSYSSWVSPFTPSSCHGNCLLCIACSDIIVCEVWLQHLCSRISLSSDITPLWWEVSDGTAVLSSGIANNAQWDCAMKTTLISGNNCPARWDCCALRTHWKQNGPQQNELVNYLMVAFRAFETD